MRQIPDYSDYRSKLRCAYCGGATGTRDHVPSRVLLNEPFPENLPVVPACRACNQSFSQHEEYLACLVAVVLAGGCDAVADVSAKAARILDSKPALRAKIASARSGAPDCPTWTAELERVEIVFRKLAQGHIYHEIAEPRVFEPDLLWAAPLTSMDPTSRQQFERVDNPNVWPEVGSRAMQRLLTGEDLQGDGWIVVQDGWYRFHVAWGGDVEVRVVLGEYLGGVVRWNA